MLRAEITSFKQGPTRDLLGHIESFRYKIDAFLGANGKMDDEEQAGQLVTSLNQEWCDKGCFFLDAGHVTFPKLETELKKYYQTRKMTSSNQSHSNQATEESHGLLGRRQRRWQTCSRTKCIGQDHPTKPHSPVDCYHNPNNQGKMDDWKREKQQAGEWVEYPRGSVQRGRGRGQSMNISRSNWPSSSSTNYPRSEDLHKEFENMKLEDREVSYNAELDGTYSCSAQPQLACRGDQCNSIALLDTGASHFMLHNKSKFDHGSLVANTNPDARLNLAGGGATLEIEATGSVTIVNSKGEETRYDDCLYVPRLSRNLITGGRLLRTGATTVLLDNPHFKIVQKGKELFTGKFVGEGSLMYVPLRTAVSQDSNSSHESTKRDQLTFLKLHYSLGHPSE